MRVEEQSKDSRENIGNICTIKYIINFVDFA
jgi:hypothetical protein